MGKLGSFLVGGVIGAGLALLLAPRSGEETRAMVADKADEYWGKSREFYDSSKARIQSTYAEVSPAIAKKGDELRTKIDNARTLIAEQVAKNAANARDMINDKMPGATEKLNHAAEAVRGRIDTAAGKIKDFAVKGRGASDTDAVDDDILGAASAVNAAEAKVVQPAVVVDSTPAIPGIVDPAQAK